MANKPCHFEWVKRAKNPYFKMQILTLNLWILRFAQYDKDFVIARICKRERANSCQSINLALPLHCGLPRLLCSLAMTDKENALCHFTMTAHLCHFWAFCKKAKNPRLNFMDTSANASVWQGKNSFIRDKQVSFISMIRTKQQTFKSRLKQTPRYLKSKFSQNNKLFNKTKKIACTFKIKAFSLVF